MSKFQGSRILQAWNAERQASRAQPVMRGQRNFQAAEVSRLTAGWATSDVAINTLLENQLAIVRARSRAWGRNTDLGKRFLRLVKNNVAGPKGVTVHSRAYDLRAGKKQFDDMANEAIERHLQLWMKSATVNGWTFRDALRTVSEVWARDGEFLAKHVRGTRANPYRYQVQLLAIDRLDIAHREVLNNGNEVRMSIEHSSDGNPVAYWILEYNPTDMGSRSRSGLNRARHLAVDVMHGFTSHDAEQLRGVPWAHAVLSGHSMLAGFEEAAVIAARVGASNMGMYVPPAVETDNGALAMAERNDDGTSPKEGEELMRDAEPGAFETLPPGWDFKQFNPAYPQQSFAPFVKARKQSIAAGLNVAHHNLTGDMEGVNYSSARIAEMVERDNWKAEQEETLDQFVKPVISAWLEMAVLSGAITMANGSSLPAVKMEKWVSGLHYVPRGWDWVDPVNEVKAAAMAREQGFTTGTKVVGAKGESYSENLAQLEQEKLLEAKHGVQIPRTAAGSKKGTEDEKTAAA